MGLGPQEFADRLVHGGWGNRPQAEREAVLAVLHLALNQSAEEPPEMADPAAWGEALRSLDGGG
jgi:hypothetical protein